MLFCPPGVLGSSCPGKQMSRAPSPLLVPVLSAARESSGSSSPWHSAEMGPALASPFLYQYASPSCRTHLGFNTYLKSYPEDTILFDGGRVITASSSLRSWSPAQLPLCPSLPFSQASPALLALWPSIPNSTPAAPRSHCTPFLSLGVKGHKLQLFQIPLNDDIIEAFSVACGRRVPM